MKKLLQTRLHNPPLTLGNCFPTVIACLMNLDSPEDVIQIQEYYGNKDWVNILHTWLRERGWNWIGIPSHLKGREYYLVTGKSPRFPDDYHVCIYRNGKLFHDPHPDQTGLLTEEQFEIIYKDEDL